MTGIILKSVEKLIRGHPHAISQLGTVHLILYFKKSEGAIRRLKEWLKTKPSGFLKGFKDDPNSYDEYIRGEFRIDVHLPFEEIVSNGLRQSDYMSEENIITRIAVIDRFGKNIESLGEELKSEENGGF